MDPISGEPTSSNSKGVSIREVEVDKLNARAVLDLLEKHSSDPRFADFSLDLAFKILNANAKIFVRNDCFWLSWLLDNFRGSHAIEYKKPGLVIHAKAWVLLSQILKNLGVQSQLYCTDIFNALCFALKNFFQRKPKTDVIIGHLDVVFGYIANYLSFEEYSNLFTELTRVSVLGWGPKVVDFSHTVSQNFLNNYHQPIPNKTVSGSLLLCLLIFREAQKTSYPNSVQQIEAYIKQVHFHPEKTSWIKENNIDKYVVFIVSTLRSLVKANYSVLVHSTDFIMGCLIDAAKANSENDKKNTLSSQPFELTVYHKFFELFARIDSKNTHFVPSLFGIASLLKVIEKLDIRQFDKATESNFEKIIQSLVAILVTDINNYDSINEIFHVLQTLFEIQHTIVLPHLPTVLGFLWTKNWETNVLPPLYCRTFVISVLKKLSQLRQLDRFLEIVVNVLTQTQTLGNFFFDREAMQCLGDLFSKLIQGMVPLIWDCFIRLWSDIWGENIISNGVCDVLENRLSRFILLFNLFLENVPILPQMIPEFLSLLEETTNSITFPIFSFVLFNGDSVDENREGEAQESNDTKKRKKTESVQQQPKKQKKDSLSPNFMSSILSLYYVLSKINYFLNLFDPPKLNHLYPLLDDHEKIVEYLLKNNGDKIENTQPFSLRMITNELLIQNVYHLDSVKSNKALNNEKDDQLDKKISELVKLLLSGNYPSCPCETKENPSLIEGYWNLASVYLNSSDYSISYWAFLNRNFTLIVKYAQQDDLKFFLKNLFTPCNCLIESLKSPTNILSKLNSLYLPPSSDLSVGVINSYTLSSLSFYELTQCNKTLLKIVMDAIFQNIQIYIDNSQRKEFFAEISDVFEKLKLNDSVNFTTILPRDLFRAKVSTLSESNSFPLTKLKDYLSMLQNFPSTYFDSNQSSCLIITLILVDYVISDFSSKDAVQTLFETRKAINSLALAHPRSFLVVFNIDIIKRIIRKTKENNDTEGEINDNNNNNNIRIELDLSRETHKIVENYSSQLVSRLLSKDATKEETKSFSKLIKLFTKKKRYACFLVTFLGAVIDQLKIKGKKLTLTESFSSKMEEIENFVMGNIQNEPEFFISPECLKCVGYLLDFIRVQTKINTNEQTQTTHPTLELIPSILTFITNNLQTQTNLDLDSVLVFFNAISRFSNIDTHQTTVFGLILDLLKNYENDEQSTQKVLWSFECLVENSHKQKHIINSMYPSLKNFYDHSMRGIIRCFGVFLKVTTNKPDLFKSYVKSMDLLVKFSVSHPNEEDLIEAINLLTTIVSDSNLLLKYPSQISLILQITTPFYDNTIASNNTNTTLSPMTHSLFTPLHFTENTFLAVFNLLKSLARFRAQETVECLSTYTQTVRNLLYTLPSIKDNKNNLSLSCAKKLAGLFETMTKSFNPIKQNLTKNVAISLISDYVHLIQEKPSTSNTNTVVLPFELRPILLEGIFPLFEICEPFDLEHLHASLSESSRYLLTEIFNDFKATRKFTGKT